MPSGLSIRRVLRRTTALMVEPMGPTFGRPDEDRSDIIGSLHH
jgi:hypothetical protein